MKKTLFVAGLLASVCPQAFCTVPASAPTSAAATPAATKDQNCALPVPMAYQDSYVSFRSENIQLTNPTVRPGKAGQNSAAFVKVTNTNKKAQKIVKATSPIAKIVELHQSIEENGIHQMRPVESIEIPGGGMVELKSGGFHIMLIGLMTDLKKWQQVPITLELDNGNQLEVTYTVKKCSDCKCGEKNKKNKSKRKAKGAEAQNAAVTATRAAAAPTTATPTSSRQPLSAGPSA